MEILAYFLAALVGGVVATLALFLALVYASRNSDGTFISFGKGDGSRISRDCELLDYERREGGLYVKVRNGSKRLANMFLFTIQVFTPDEKLVDQFESTLHAYVGPGEVEEAIVKLEDYRNPNGINLIDRRVEARLKCMYTENESQTCR